MLAYINCNAQYKKMFIVKCLLYSRCGHSYHKGCLQSVGSVHVIDGEDSWICFCVVIGNVASFKARDSIEVSVTVGNPKAKM